MKVLGLDPSLTNFGWALLDTDIPSGTKGRCVDRGLFKTPAKMEFVERYIVQRERLKELVEKRNPDFVGIEFPVFNNLWSEGMYGLFLYCCEALKSTNSDVVFWAPLQVKAHARSLLDRPKGWKMDKVDMVEAAKKDSGGGRWNHNEADAYLVGRLASRFWELHEGVISEGGLSTQEKKYFLRVHTFKKGRRTGKTVKSGVIYREDERFFQWSKRS